MGNIRIYDADTFMRQELEMCCFRFEKVAILEGPHGVVIAEHEGVHDVLHSLADSFRFDLTKIPPPGTLYVMPSAYTDVPVSEIKDHAPSEEMDFYDFFSRRNYNPRCEANFRYLCKHLREIGFEIPKESLKAQVQNAGTKVIKNKGEHNPIPPQER